MNLRNDRYLDPPDDEPEVGICESCGKEMDYVSPMVGECVELTCNNPFCPDKFTTGWKVNEKIAKEMAEKIVELEDDNAILRDELRWANKHKQQFLAEINELKSLEKDYKSVLAECLPYVQEMVGIASSARFLVAEIKDLTQSQKGEE